MHKAQVPTSMHIVTGGNTAKLFQLEKKAFLDVAFLVSPVVCLYLRLVDLESTVAGVPIQHS